MGVLADRLEHSGVKGMKWGVRRQKKNTARYQRDIIDPTRRVASGVGSKRDKQINFNNSSWATIATAKRTYKDIPFSQALAKKNLDLYKKDAAKIASGKTTLQGVMAKMQGVKMSDLKLSTKGIKGNTAMKRQFIDSKTLSDMISDQII